MLSIALIALVLGVATVARTDVITPLPEKVAQVFTSRFFPGVLNWNQEFGQNLDVVLSGFSLLQPLSQLTLISQGEPHDELMSNGLGLTDERDVKLVAKIYRQIFESKQDIVKFVHKLYISNIVPINESYASDQTKLWGPDFEIISFADVQKAAEEINNYVSGNTNGKVKNLVDSQKLSFLTDAVLVNSVYFKSEWEKKFPKVYTQTQDFFYDEGQAVQKDFIIQQADYRHGFSHQLDAELLQLNYKTEGFYFNIALPKQINGLPALLEKYKKHDGNLYVENNKFKSETIKIYLPKFEVEAITDLKPVLESLGVRKIFEANIGNLRNLLKTVANVSVTLAVQKVFINVDEKGTEAASADDVQAEPQIFGAAAEAPVVFKANVPFYYEVNFYGYTLFSGTVNFDPRIKG